MWRKENPGTQVVAMKICAATVANSMKLPQKTNNRTTT